MFTPIIVTDKSTGERTYTMNRMDQARKAFIEVQDELHQGGKLHAERLSWKKPLKFYLEHSKREAIKILEEEAEELK